VIFTTITKDLQKELKSNMPQIMVLLKKQPAIAYKKIGDIGKEVGKKYNSQKGKVYSHTLADYIQYGKSIRRIISDLDDGYNLEELNDYIKPERDKQFTYLGIITLHDRYILKDFDKSPIEALLLILCS